MGVLPTTLCEAIRMNVLNAPRTSLNEIEQDGEMTLSGVEMKVCRREI